MELKELSYDGAGYMPLVLTTYWQLAQLNYAPEQNAEVLNTLDQHDFTDETFTLIQGRALLITYDRETEECTLTPLRKGSTYNVPAMMWHNIAMEKSSVVMITEGRDAHLKGCTTIPMPESVREAMVAYVKENWGI